VGARGLRAALQAGCLIVSMERPAPVRIWRGSPTLVRAEPPYGRSRPWPVSRTLPRSISAWTSTRTRSRWGSCHPTSRSPTWSGSPMTRSRSAGSSAALVIPAICEPATRPARPALSWPGCWTACTCVAR
jgi:hypothetical protein